MTNIPAKIVQRRWELKRWAEYHREKIEDHGRSLIVVEAQLEQIDFDTGAYADCARSPDLVDWSETPADEAGAQERPCTCHPEDNPPVPCPRKFALSECIAAATQRPNAEAGAQGLAAAATSGAPEAESAPADIYGGQSLGAVADERLDSRTPALGEADASLSRSAPPPTVVSEDGITYGIGGLLAFLQAAPNSTMAEINAAGIPTAEVYQAERDGAVRLVQTTIGGLGLYALPLRSEAEAQQSEATE